MAELQKFQRCMVLVTRLYQWDEKAWEALVCQMLDERWRGAAWWGPAVPPFDQQLTDQTLPTRAAKWSKVLGPDGLHAASAGEATSHCQLGALFATGERLLELLPAREDEVHPFRALAGETFISLDLNLALVGGERWLVPQLRLSDYWPRNRQLAPDPSRVVQRGHAPDGDRRSPSETGLTLNNSLWMAADDAVQELLTSAGIVPVEMKVHGYHLRPPTFYSAQSVTPPPTPDEFLGPEFLPSVRLLCRETLECDDPRSDQVAGLFVEGNVALLRREFVFPSEAPQYAWFNAKRTENHYLCLGWHDTHDPDDLARIEWDLCFAAQRLSLLDIRIGVGLAELVAENAEHDRRAEPLETWLRQKNTDITKLQKEAVRARRGKRRKKFGKMAGIGGELYGRRPQIIAAVGQADRIERAVQHVVDDAAEQTEKALTFRALADLQPLTGTRLRSSPMAKVVRRQVEDSKRVIVSVSNESEKLSAFLDSAVAIERREAERRSSRHQKVLNYVLAALAGVTALGIIVGQIDDAKVKKAADGWGGPFGVFDLLGRFATNLSGPWRDDFMVVGVLAAFLVIAMLVGIAAYGVWTFFSGDAQAAPDQPDLDPPSTGPPPEA
ncbi:MAG: hypothetical protein QOJ69_845 [Actinomycetota bacterium]|nr:hypothetical protein [Actinomycetota bacterium]